VSSQTVPHIQRDRPHSGRERSRQTSREALLQQGSPLPVPISSSYPTGLRPRARESALTLTAATPSAAVNGWASSRLRARRLDDVRRRVAVADLALSAMAPRSGRRATPRRSGAGTARPTSGAAFALLRRQTGPYRWGLPVEVGGLEPPSHDVVPGLLRAQPPGGSRTRVVRWHRIQVPAR
jgi:hypothetical protein